MAWVPFFNLLQRDTMRRISARPASVIRLALMFFLAGCAGPKRMPPIVTGPAELPGPGLRVPALLGVGLLEGEPRLTVFAGGPAELLDGGDNHVLARLPRAGRGLKCERQGEQVVWRVAGQQGRAAAVILRPLDPATRVGLGDLEYRGEFLVLCSPLTEGLTLVNTVDLESYLKGVVPWEIGRHGPERMAALQAQAVAARTYTMAHWGARRSHGFDVFASVMDQVYKGAADEDPLCNEAVTATADLVLQYQGEEIEAFYSACCGGASSNIEEVWARGNRPYLHSAADGPDHGGRAFCAGSRYFHWRESWTVGQLEEILARTLPAYLDWLAESPARIRWTGPAFSARDGSSEVRRPGHLRNLEILARTTSGRVADLAITTDAGVYHVRGDRIRWVLPPASGNPFILRSAMFDLELERDGNHLQRVAIRGRGFGHGIGLCQTGALERAGQGQSFEEILAHYYPGSVLTRLAGGRKR